MAVEFPFGHPLGKPFDKELQMKIINDSFDALQTMTAPDDIRDLPYTWSDEDTEKQDWWPEEAPPIAKFMMEQLAKKKKTS